MSISSLVEAIWVRLPWDFRESLDERKYKSFNLSFSDKIERLPFDTGSLFNLDDQEGWEPEVVRSPILRIPATSNNHWNPIVERRRKEETTSKWQLSVRVKNWIFDYLFSDMVGSYEHSGPAPTLLGPCLAHCLPFPASYLRKYQIICSSLHIMCSWRPLRFCSCSSFCLECHVRFPCSFWWMNP